MKSLLKRGWRIVVLTVSSALNKDVSLLAAGLAFFALISMAPFLIIAVAVAGAIFGTEAARDELFDRVAAELGPQVAELVTSLAASARQLSSISVATLISVVVLFWGSTRLFAEVRRALHALWDVPARRTVGWRGAVFGFLKARLVAAIGTVIFGAVFLALLGSRIALNVTSDVVGEMNFLSLPMPIWAVIETAVAMLVVAALIVIIYRLLPDRTPHGWPLWIGALVTSGLLLVGRFLVSIYVAAGAIQSAYGAAGALVVFLVWAYFSSLAFLVGARLTHLLEVGADQRDDDPEDEADVALLTLDPNADDAPDDAPDAATAPRD